MKPKVTHKKENPAILVCKAGGNPKPTVLWYKGNERVTDNSGEISEDRFTLKVKYPNRSTSKYITCVVSNRYGSIRYEFELITEGTSSACVRLFVH